jgi:hypothetical protein
MRLICDAGCGSWMAYGDMAGVEALGYPCDTRHCKGRLMEERPERDLDAEMEAHRERREQTLPTSSQARKDTPMARGGLDYFPAAFAAVAQLSKAGNDKHNPGEDLHHARGKSTDHADCILRHLVDRGSIDEEDGILHDTKVAWRALAMLQEELERRGAPKARGAR